MKRTFLAIFLLPLALTAQQQAGSNASNVDPNLWSQTPADTKAPDNQPPAPAQGTPPAQPATSVPPPSVTTAVPPSIAKDSSHAADLNPPTWLIAKDSALPMTIPGYELKVLDVQKPVLFYVNGVWVKASLPIFCYYPTAPQVNKEAADKVDSAYVSLLNLSSKPSWDARELLAVLRRLKEADEALHSQPVAPAPAVTKPN